MGGANYMGGKRNAAKARTKDATTRTQKGFFGRRRFDILARGLALNQSRVNDTENLRKNDIRPLIDLAHAKRDAPLKESQNVNATPQKRSSVKKGTDSSGVASDRSNSSQKSNSSKVLTMLDTTEPLSMRADMNRLLALPDFAGLSMTRTYPQPPSTTKNTFRKRSRSPTSEDPVSVPRKKTRYSHEAVDSDSDSGDHQIHSRISSPSIYQRRPGIEIARAPAYLSSLETRSLEYHNPISMSPGPSADLIEPRSHRMSDDMESGFDHSDSGYAASNAQIGHSGGSVSSGRLLHHPVYARSNQYQQQQTLASRSDSFILDLDTSPPSTHTRSEGSQDIDRSQSSSPSSLDSYFSVIAPQPLSIFSRPMNPSQYSKQIAAHDQYYQDEHPMPMPQSSAPEPPLTFCMPSPKKHPRSRLGNLTQELEDELSSSVDEHEPMHDNLLDDPDPWDTIGKILDLDDTMKSPSAPASPHRVSYDRHGVGYVSSIPTGQQDEPACDARMDSPQQSTQQPSLTPETHIRPFTLPDRDRAMISREDNTTSPPKLSASAFLASMLKSPQTTPSRHSLDQDTTEQLMDDVEQTDGEGGAPTVFVSTASMFSPEAKFRPVSHNQNSEEQLIEDLEHEWLTLSDDTPKATLALSPQIGEASMDAQGPYLFFDLDDDDDE